MNFQCSDFNDASHRSFWCFVCFDSAPMGRDVLTTLGTFHGKLFTLDLQLKFHGWRLLCKHRKWCWTAISRKLFTLVQFIPFSIFDLVNIFWKTYFFNLNGKRSYNDSFHLLWHKISSICLICFFFFGNEPSNFKVSSRWSITYRLFTPKRITVNSGN